MCKMANKSPTFRLSPLCGVELKPKSWQNVPPRGFSRTALPGDLNRSPGAPKPDLQLGHPPIERHPHAHCHTGKFDRGGTAEKRFVTEKSVYIQKRTERAYFPFWPARTNMEGGGSGRGTNIYAHWRLRVRIPLCTCVSFCWLLVLWGASRSARKKASCARPQWRKLRVWGLAAGRLFSDFFRCVFCGL